jgi:hypothetical protein
MTPRPRILAFSRSARDCDAAAHFEPLRVMGATATRGDRRERVHGRDRPGGKLEQNIPRHLATSACLPSGPLMPGKRRSDAVEACKIIG